MKVDQWDLAHTKSSFYLDLDYIPRVGEIVDIHTSFLPENWLDSADPLNQGVEVMEDAAQFVVKNVRYLKLPDRTEVEIDVDPRWT